MIFNIVCRLSSFEQHPSFQKLDHLRASEVDPRLAIQSKDIDCEAGGVSVLSAGAVCSLMLNFSHEFFGLFNFSTRVLPA